MFTTRNARTPRRRRGMILMVVLALLTLFAILGISFVLVAQSQETSARIARESETHFKPDIDPEAAFFYAMGQLLYDRSDDDNAGIYSALRGHSLARNMYGWNPDALNDKPFTGVGRLAFSNNPVAPNSGTKLRGTAINENDIKLMNYVPFWSNPTTVEYAIRDPERIPQWDNATDKRLQYRLWDPATKQFDAVDKNVQTYVPMGGVPYTYPDHNAYFLAQIDPKTGKIVTPSFHREYLFGRLDLPKDRPAAPNNTPFVHYNPHWQEEAKGKYYTLRPTPGYHGTFPMPIDRNGDVKNLDGVPGGADSIWIDIGAPVMRTNDGRKYKMLVAPLILDLDGRIDLNVVGNLMGGQKPTPGNPPVAHNQEHRSNQGWGPWEVNPQKVLNADTTEWRKLFYGSAATGQARYPGRYDTNNAVPTAATPAPDDRSRVPLGATLAGVDKVRGWAQLDYNGAKDDTNKSAAERYAMPTAGTAGAYFGFPDFSTGLNTYNNGKSVTVDENADHARLYWAMNPAGRAVTPDTGSNRRFPIKDLVRILRDGGTGSDMIPTDLRELLKSNLWTGADAARRRNLITLLSADLDRPGATPYVWDPYANNTTTGLADSQETRFRLLQEGNRWSFTHTTGALRNKGIPFPDPFTLRTTTGPALNAPDGSDFDKTTWRGSLAGLNQRLTQHSGDLAVMPTPRAVNPALTKQPRQRLNLGRSLYKYPAPNATTGLVDLTDMTTDTNGKTVQQQYDQAKADREQFAADLFAVLRQAAGVDGGVENATESGDINDVVVGMTVKRGIARKVKETTSVTTPLPGGEFHALRGLAQIAVNIVDYLDNDDVFTVFNWATYYTGGDTSMQVKENVVGFELPRLVLNETYVQYDNVNGTITAGAVDPANPIYNVNVWTELMNPMPNDSVAPLSNPTDTTAQLTARDAMNNPDLTKPMYRILLADGDLNNPTTPPMPPALPPLRDPANVTGDPDFGLTAPATRVKPTTVGGMTYCKMETWDDSPGADPIAARPNRPITVPPATNRFKDATLPDPLNDGFYVVGPKLRHFSEGGNESNPNLPTTILSDKMTYQVTAEAATDATTPKLTVILQRLANPALPVQTNPNPPPGDPAPNYNPWITIDFVDHDTATKVTDGRYFNLTGAGPAAAMDTRKTLVRRQPYAAAQLTQYDAVPTTPPVPPTPRNTFFRQNSEAETATVLDAATTDTYLQLPFDWLVHLDRKPISPAELLHVSAAPPHLVTQDFVQATALNSPAHLHTVPWSASDARLYRFFEFVSVPPAGTGTITRTPTDTTMPATAVTGDLPVQLDRVMGKVNINSVWNRDVFRALADAQGGNVFTETEVDTMFTTLVTNRSRKAQPHGTSGDYHLDNAANRGLRPTDTNLSKALAADLKTAMGLAETDAEMDRPFWSLAMGHRTKSATLPTPNTYFADRVAAAAGDPTTGITDTLLRPGLFDVPTQTHPYQKKQLLTKIFNQLTTRSNVYAVWLTVGFFEVVKDDQFPVVLGKEMGKSENRHVRHRMFAIVDRTNFKAFETTCWDFNLRSVVTGGAAGDWKPGDPVQVQLTDPTTIGTATPAEAAHSNMATVTMDIRDTRTPRVWKVGNGTVLTFEPNTNNEESVVLYTDTTINPPNGKLVARFQRTHPKGCKVICRGNPGPMERYNPRDEPEVVPFFMLID